MFKKVLLTVMSFLLLFSIGIHSSFAESKVKYEVFLNGFKMNSDSVKQGNIIYFDAVPLFKYLGYNVAADASKTFTISKGNTKLIYKLGDQSYLLNGKENLVGNNILVQTKLSVYVSGEFFEKMMDIKYKKSDKDEMINFGSYVPWKKGSVKGHLTYKSKILLVWKSTNGDNGSMAFLFPTKPIRQIDFEPIESMDFGNITANFANKLFQDFYTATVNSDGDYRFLDMPEGEYYLLVISNNVESDLKLKTEPLKNMMTKKAINYFELICHTNKHELKKVKIKNNKVITFDKNFGEAK